MYLLDTTFEMTAHGEKSNKWRSVLKFVIYNQQGLLGEGTENIGVGEGRQVQNYRRY